MCLINVITDRKYQTDQWERPEEYYFEDYPLYLDRKRKIVTCEKTIIQIGVISKPPFDLPCGIPGVAWSGPGAPAILGSFIEFWTFFSGEFLEAALD